MPLPRKPSKNIFDYPARFQFGQGSAPCSGSSACTDTCIQMIVEYYKDEHYDLNTIRRVSQRRTGFDERPCTGLNYVEVLNGLAYFGIHHYEVKFGADSMKVYNKVEIGPVIVGVHYGSYPYRNGKYNTAEISGKTDTAFRGSHAILAVGRRVHDAPKDWHRDIYIRDPDHNSPSRPETPKYDRIRRMQLERAMQNLIPYTLFKNTYIIAPTKKKHL